MSCPVRDCYIKSPHTHGAATGLADGEEAWTLVTPRNSHGPRNALEELAQLPPIQTIHGPHCGKAIEERDRLRSDIATLGTVEMMIRNPNIDSYVREHEARLNEAEAELAEIKKVLIGYHLGVGVGILAVVKLAKRIYEASAPKADLSATGYFSPVAEPSSPEEISQYDLEIGLEIQALFDREEAGP